MCRDAARVDSWAGFRCATFYEQFRRIAPNGLTSRLRNVDSEPHGVVTRVGIRCHPSPEREVTRVRQRGWIAGVLVAGLLAVSACTSDPGALPSEDTPTATPSTSPAASSSPDVAATSSGPPETTSSSPAPTSSQPTTSRDPTTSSRSAPETPTTATTLDKAAREKADRKAVEAAWINYWKVYVRLPKVTPKERMKLTAAVAVEPMLSNLVAATNGLDAQHIVNYGGPVHHLSWKTPINGAKSARIRDCSDESNFGAMNTKTGKKLTVGGKYVNTEGVLVKGVDGKWRVQEVVEYSKEECTW